MNNVIPFPFKPHRPPQERYDPHCMPYEIVQNMGKLLVIRCAFCKHLFEARIANLYSPGKCCPNCEAKHLANGRAHQKVQA